MEQQQFARSHCPDTLDLAIVAVAVLAVDVLDAEQIQERTAVLMRLRKGATRVGSKAVFD